MVELSVVIPCYHSSASLPGLIGELSTLLSNNAIEYEMILVNDASNDKTWETITDLSLKNQQIIGINLEENVGQEIATLCGLTHSNGHFCVTMDDDLQHTPEGVLILYNSIRLRNDIDVIIASFPHKQHNLIRYTFTRVQRLIRNLSFKNARDINFTSFRILRKGIVDEIINLRIGFPKVGLLSLMVTNKIMNVNIEHFKRPMGKSNYSVSRLTRSFLNSLFYYTALPVKALFWGGVLFIFFSLFYLGLSFILPEIVNPFCISFIAFAAGVILIALSATCFYLVTLRKQFLTPAKYLVKEIVGSTFSMNNQ